MLYINSILRVLCEIICVYTVDPLIITIINEVYSAIVLIHKWYF